MNDRGATHDSFGASNSARAEFSFCEPARPTRAEPFHLINNILDGIAGPHYFFVGVETSPYVGLGICGIASGLTLMTGLGLWLGISVSALIGLAVAALATFVLVGLTRKAIAKTDRHILLEDMLAVLATGGLVTWAMGGPVRLTVDVLVLGLGVFLIFGRLACLVCGCCHGRPARIGISYRAGAIDDALTGIRVFPIQLVEAGWIALLTIVGVTLTLGKVEPGTTLWFWVIGYALGRFVIEFARGDIRPRFGPLSEAQWTVLALLTARVVYEGTASGFNPAPLGIYSAAAALALSAYATKRFWLAALPQVFRLSEVQGWQNFLEKLENEATAQRSTREVFRVAPNEDFAIALSIEAADDNLSLHSYSLRGSSGPVESRVAIAISGMLLQRLPAHSILRAGFCDAGVFHLWALVDPHTRPGTTVADRPWWVLMRAQGFSQSLVMTQPLNRGQSLEIDPRWLPIPAPPGPAPPDNKPAKRWQFLWPPPLVRGTVGISSGNGRDVFGRK